MNPLILRVALQINVIGIVDSGVEKVLVPIQPIPTTQLRGIFTQATALELTMNTNQPRPPVRHRNKQSAIQTSNGNIPSSAQNITQLTHRTRIVYENGPFLCLMIKSGSERSPKVEVLQE